jgi:hypothetical protein
MIPRYPVGKFPRKETSKASRTQLDIIQQKIPWDDTSSNTALVSAIVLLGLDFETTVIVDRAVIGLAAARGALSFLPLFLDFLAGVSFADDDVRALASTVNTCIEFKRT